MIFTQLAPPLTLSSLAAEDSGTWRGKWWNYYERGRDFADRGEWGKALQDFSNAIDLREKDQRRARTYGMHFTDYFPHRELGVTFFHLGDFSRALKELELSSRSVETDKTNKYLDRVRKALLSGIADRQILPPRITLSTPTNGILVKDRSIRLKGTASGEGFVSSISINGTPYPVDKGEKEISFSRDIQLEDGSNAISVVVTDLAGNTSETKVSVIAKRDGPGVTLSEVVPELRDGKRFVKVNGEVTDSAGIRRILVASQQVDTKDVNRYQLDMAVERTSENSTYQIRAFDILGNETVAIIDLSQIIRAEKDDSERAAAHQRAELEQAARDKVSREQQAVQQREDERLADLQREAQRLVLLQAAADKIAQAKSAAERLARETAEQLRIAAEKAEQQKLATERAEAERLVLEKAEQERVARVQAAQDKLARETAEKQRRADEKREMERLAQERITQERLAQEKAEEQRNAVARAEQERLAQERAELEKLALQKAMAEQAALVKAEAEQRAREEAERTRISNEKIEQDRLASEKAAAEKDAADKIEQQRLAEQKAEQQRLIRQTAEAERVAQEQQAAREKEEFEKREREKTHAIQVERQKLKAILDEQKLNQALGAGSDKQLELGKLTSGEGTKAYQPPVKPLPEPVRPSVAAPDTSCVPVLSDHENPIITIKGLNDIPQVFVDSFPLDGEISDNCRVEKLLINGRNIAINKGRKIYFSKVIRIENGENIIRIEAFDAAGNKADGTVIVTRKLPSVMQNGSRMSLVVLPFDFDRTDGSATPLASDYLTGAITEQKRFLVAERQKLKNVLEEQKFTHAVIEDTERTAQLGKIMAAEAIVATNVRETDHTLEVTSRVINSETAEIMDVLDAYTEDKSAPSVKELMAGLAAKIARVFPVAEGTVISQDDDQVMTDLGSGSHIRNRHGAIFYRKGNEVIHPTSGKSLGRDSLKLGEGYIEDVQEGFSKVRLADRYRDIKINPSDLVVTK